eukprot:9460685-Alexandrium_andersonii.AAC.1
MLHVRPLGAAWGAVQVGPVTCALGMRPGRGPALPWGLHRQWSRAHCERAAATRGHGSAPRGI